MDHSMSKDRKLFQVYYEYNRQRLIDCRVDEDLHGPVLYIHSEYLGPLQWIKCYIVDGYWCFTGCNDTYHSDGTVNAKCIHHDVLVAQHHSRE
jgi:hypothetical protein